MLNCSFSQNIQLKFQNKYSVLSIHKDCKYEYDQVRVTLMEVLFKSPNILIPSQVVEINLASLISKLPDAT